MTEREPKVISVQLVFMTITKWIEAVSLRDYKSVCDVNFEVKLFESPHRTKEKKG